MSDHFRTVENCATLYIWREEEKNKKKMEWKEK
jgi:hypothetical protein